MNPENKKLEFLGSCGILLREQAQVTPEKKEQQSKQLADIKKVAFFSGPMHQFVE